MASTNGTSKEVEKGPENRTLIHAWMWEPTSYQKGALTKDGIENIARHKYVSGHYTSLDNFLNPMWNYLTDNLLPMWLAPNAVTTIGGLHCLVAYCVLWWHSPNFDQQVPDWTVLLSGYCLIAYYTFDCMDGKQARRTGTSSPLGQLFDHGVDCICNLCFVSSIFGLVMMSSQWALLIQCSLQFTFYMAQWEEYHTGILQHSVGNVGVTETNYGLGLFTILNAFLDRRALWRFPIQNILPFVPEHIHLGHAALSTTVIMLSLLVLGSFNRVIINHYSALNKRMFALGQLLTPASMLLAVVFLPKAARDDNTRYVSLATGLLFSLLTQKVIIFSMAKMTFATIQLEAIPLFLVSIYIHLYATHIELILQLLCLWYAYRLHKFAWLAVHQLCERLDINCFSIKNVKNKAD